MGSLTIYKYSKETKKWDGIGDHTIGGNWANMDYLYTKYFPQLPRINGRSSVIPLEEFNGFYNNLKRMKNIQWYEQVLFRLTSDHNYFKAEQKPLVLKALAYMEKENPVSQGGYLSFNDKLKNFLAGLNLDKDTAISFGYSSGGFWGTDAEDVLKSIQVNFSAAMMDKISDNVNVDPFYWGTDIFSDYSDEQIKTILELKDL